jgi:hypothetical protein
MENLEKMPPRPFNPGHFHRPGDHRSHRSITAEASRQLIVSRDGRTRMQAGGSLLTIAMPTTAKAIRKPGKNRPASSRSRIPGPPLRNFTQKICFQNKTLCSKPTTRLTRRGFCTSRFLRSQPRRLGPGSAYRARPRYPDLHSSRFVPQRGCRTGWFVARTDLLNLSSAGNTTRNHGCA